MSGCVGILVDDSLKGSLLYEFLYFGKGDPSPDVQTMEFLLVQRVYSEKQTKVQRIFSITHFTAKPVRGTLH